MKKLIASLLTVATVASMASMTAFAEDTSVEAKDTKVEAALTTNMFYDDKPMTSNDIQPDETFYIDLDTFTGIPSGVNLLDGDLFKVKFDKGDDDSKMIKKISVVEDDVNGGGARENVIKIELKDDMSDDEFKINPSVTFTAKEDVVEEEGTTPNKVTTTYKDGYKLTVELKDNIYISNNEVKGDKDWDAGVGGVVAKPTKNDDNEVTWEDKNDTIVKLTFEGDDDAAKYYPKLSTKWEDAHYAENFADTDAFIRSFVGNPTIPAISRPVLEFYSPFVDDDDEFTVAPEDVVIYEVVDGALEDVTEKFTIAENDDDDTVFMIKTRTLGTYIFSNGPAVAPAEEIEEPIEEPADEKANPGTGRF